MKNLILISVFVFLMSACISDTENPPQPVKVEIVKTDNGFQLMRGGEPYSVKGAGMAVDDIERFAARGGNSIRTWNTLGGYQDTQALLDSAHANGVTVALGLPMRAERHGFNYHDADAVAEQFEVMRQEVLKYRDHPAVLAWLIGNELNHSYTNPAVYDAVNDVARMIHELDPNHPASTTVSGFHDDVVAEILARAPELDFISFQLYGGLFGLPAKIAEFGFDDPFMVTEWGTIGYWGMERTSWDIPVELTSSEKADIIRRANDEVLATFEDQLLGSYVFFWGQKQERTPTWFGMLTEAGEETETVDVMHFIWNGDWPDNRAPRIDAISLDGKSHRQSVILMPGETYDVVLNVSDSDGDPLTFRWEVKPESTAHQEGGDFEAAIPNLEGLVSSRDTAKTTLMAPEPGAYRLFAYAYDDHGHAAHANIPFLVQDGTREGATVQAFKQSPDELVVGEVMAISYSGFREGQHPDRGEGANNPSDEEIVEDLEIMAAHDFRLIRMYDSGENTRATIELIRKHQLPIKVLLGIWLKAEFSNHEGCPWLDEPIPDEELALNTLDNAAELRRAIGLANEFADIVVAVNVGNEALVEWNDHMVPLDTVIEYVRQVKAAIEQPVTVADNYLWWVRDGAPLAAEVDFLGVHTYAQWEEKTIDEAIPFTIENIADVHRALPDKPIAILEAGWATVSSEFGDRASEESQVRYYEELYEWARDTNITVFFFEAFDEPWKGKPDDPLGAEKHWGLFNVDRTPKKIFE
jgi:exo-beta-1,3-glucanase (GH17 family)